MVVQLGCKPPKGATPRSNMDLTPCLDAKVPTGQRLLPFFLAGLAVIVGCLDASAQSISGAAPSRSSPDALRRAAMNEAGNPERGKVSFSSPARACGTCHKVRGLGGDVGPDLSQIGGKFDRTHLIESIDRKSTRLNSSH